MGHIVYRVLQELERPSSTRKMEHKCDFFVCNVLNNWSILEISNFVQNGLCTNRDFYAILEALAKKRGVLTTRDREIFENLLTYGAGLLGRFIPFSAMIVKQLAIKKESELLLRFLRIIRNFDFLIDYSGFDYSTLQVCVSNALDDVVEYILQQRPNVDRRIPEIEQTALHVAASNKNCNNIADMLLRSGADLEARDKNGKTPFHVAACCNNIDLIEFFIHRNADHEAVDLCGYNALHFLFSSLENIDLNLCKILLDLGLDPNSKTVPGRTPLHCLVLNGYVHNKIKTTKMLIEYGADLNGTDSIGENVLHCASSRCAENVAIIKFLLEKGTSTIFNDMNQTFIDILELNNKKRSLEILSFLTLREQTGHFDFSADLRHSIDQNKDFSFHYSLFKKELETLTEEKLDNGSQISLLDALKMKDVELAKMCNEDMLKKSHKRLQKNNISYYKEEILRKLERALRIHEAENTLYEFLLKVSKGQLHHDLIINIIKCHPPKLFKKTTLALKGI